MTPFEAPAGIAALSTIVCAPRPRDRRGVIVVLVLLSAAGGVAYVLATGQI
jgi:hypothetical protein